MKKSALLFFLSLYAFFNLFSQSVASKDYLSVFADHRIGQVIITVTTSRGSTALRYFDYEKMIETDQKLFSIPPGGWKPVHLLEGEDRRWELKILEAVNALGWELEHQDFSVALGSVITETYTQLEREIRNTYLFSRASAKSPPLDTLYSTQGDITGDDRPETIAIVYDPELALLGGEATRTLMISNETLSTPFATTASIPAYNPASGKSDPVKMIAVEEGMLVFQIQLPGLPQINTYYFGPEAGKLILQRVRIGGSIIRSSCYFSMDMYYDLRLNTANGVVTPGECENRKRSSRPIVINETVEHYAPQELGLFVPGNQYFRLRKEWSGKVMY